MYTGEPLDCAAVLAWILIEPRVVATEPVESEPVERAEETPAPELTTA